jgi:DeoR family transcriptional regulator of aga operon
LKIFYYLNKFIFTFILTTKRRFKLAKIRNITDRHQFIIDKLNELGKVNVQLLSEELAISEVTIRKDLKLLEDKKLLFRTHGGGTKLNPYTMDRSVSIKEQINPNEKERIALCAVKMIAQNDSVIIGSGTTTLAMAKAIQRDKLLNVITSSLDISSVLAQYAMIEVLQLGGQIRPSSNSAVGPYAEQILEDISCGILFLGADGIDLEKGLTTTNLLEARLNRKMMDSAQVTVVLVDSSKFGRRGLGKICDLSQIEHIITDNGISEMMLKALEELGVKVTVV